MSEKGTTDNGWDGVLSLSGLSSGWPVGSMLEIPRLARHSCRLLIHRESQIDLFFDEMNRLGNSVPSDRGSLFAIGNYQVNNRTYRMDGFAEVDISCYFDFHFFGARNFGKGNDGQRQRRWMKYLWLWMAASASRHCTDVYCKQFPKIASYSWNIILHATPFAPRSG